MTLPKRFKSIHIILLSAILFLSIAAACANGQETDTGAIAPELEKLFNITTYTRYLLPAAVEAQPGNVSILEAGGESTYNFKVLGKLPISISASIDYIGIDKSILRPLPNSLVNVGVTLETKLPLLNIKNTYLGVSINPSFASDIHCFGVKSFLMPTRLVVIYIPNKQLTFICGPEIFTDFNNDTQIVGGIIYTPTDKITISLTTDYPHILYKINDKIDFTVLEGQWVLYDQFKVRLGSDDNILIKYREAWIGSGFHFHPTKHIDTSFSAGGVFNREFKSYGAGEKIDIDKGYYIQGVAIIDF